MGRCKNLVYRNFPWKYLIIWERVLPFFREHRTSSSWSLPWILARVYCRSATAVANNSILAELVGEWHCLVGIGQRIYKLSVTRWTRSEDQLYIMVIIVDNSVLYNWNLPGQQTLNVHTHKKKKVNMWGDWCVNYLNGEKLLTVHVYIILSHGTL